MIISNSRPTKLVEIGAIDISFHFNFYLFYSSTIISFYLQLFLIFLRLLSHFISLSSFYLTFYYFINNVKRLEIIVSFNNLIKRLTNKLYYYYYYYHYYYYYFSSLMIFDGAVAWLILTLKVTVKVNEWHLICCVSYPI